MNHFHKISPEVALRLGYALAEALDDDDSTVQFEEVAIGFSGYIEPGMDVMDELRELRDGGAA